MIPLSVPNLSAHERDMVARAIESSWVSTAGPDIKAFEKRMASYCGTRFGVACNSGTAALHLAFRVLETQPEDLVIAPNLTFVASLNAISYTGAQPLLVDANPVNAQMDLDLLADYLEKGTKFQDGITYDKASGKRIRAILVVHVLGYCCDMERLMALANARDIPVVEDAAEALGSQWQGRQLGKIGLIGCLSFNGNKVLTSGSGGMLLTTDQRLADFARHLSTQAKSFSAEYIHDFVGYNYRMANLNAALGLAQMDRLEEFLGRKQAVFARYSNAFEGMDIRMLDFPMFAKPNHWLSTIFTPQSRQLEDFLTYNQIQVRKLWLPMNRLPMYRKCRYVTADDNSFRLYEDSLSLPCSTGISEEEVGTVIEKIQSFFGQAR